MKGEKRRATSRGRRKPWENETETIVEYDWNEDETKKRRKNDRVIEICCRFHRSGSETFVFEKKKNTENRGNNSRCIVFLRVWICNAMENQRTKGRLTRVSRNLSPSQRQLRLIVPQDSISVRIFECLWSRWPPLGSWIETRDPRRTGTSPNSDERGNCSLGRVENILESKENIPSRGKKTFSFEFRDSFEFESRPKKDVQRRERLQSDPLEIKRSLCLQMRILPPYHSPWISKIVFSWTFLAIDEIESIDELHSHETDSEKREKGTKRIKRTGSIDRQGRFFEKKKENSRLVGTTISNVGARLFVGVQQRHGQQSRRYRSIVEYSRMLLPRRG